MPLEDYLSWPWYNAKQSPAVRLRRGLLTVWTLRLLNVSSMIVRHVLSSTLAQLRGLVTSYPSRHCRVNDNTQCCACRYRRGTYCSPYDVRARVPSLEHAELNGTARFHDVGIVVPKHYGDICTTHKVGRKR